MTRPLNDLTARAPATRSWTVAASMLLVVAVLAACGGAPEAAGDETPAEPIQVEPAPETTAPEAAPDDTGRAEHGAAEAAAVIQRYYAAIDAGDYARAYRLWSDGGRASGQSLASFASGFDDTTSVGVDIGAPGRVEAAAGSRYIEVPVTVRAVHADRSEHRFEGTYTLRRAVVDGATPEQRQWRIASARLREVTARSGS